MDLENGGQIFGKIYKTKDYTQFKLIHSNRKINPMNYLKLYRSMKEEQLKIPICINENNEVIDGQHRLRVCEELGLPVYYYILHGYSISQMKRANLVSANWKKEDFLNLYVNQNEQSYIEFSEILNRFKIKLSDLLKVIAKVQKKNNSAIGHAFQDGYFDFTPEEKKEVEKFLNALEEFNFFSDYKKGRFIGAFIKLYFSEGYIQSQMSMRLKTRAEALEVQLSIADYLKVLTNKIYSFGNSKNGIYYDSDRKRLYSLE
jgi:hypothetical protein